MFKQPQFLGMVSPFSLDYNTAFDFIDKGVKSQAIRTEESTESEELRSNQIFMNDHRCRTQI